MTPRILITVIIIFNFLLVLGQEVSLHIYVKCCNGEIYPIEFHMIETASETGFGKIDTGNVVVLPDTGLYYLHYTEDPILIHVNNFGINYDTINDC